MTPRIGNLPLNAARKPLLQLRLQGVIAGRGTICVQHGVVQECAGTIFRQRQAARANIICIEQIVRAIADITDIQ